MVDSPPPSAGEAMVDSPPPSPPPSHPPSDVEAIVDPPSPTPSPPPSDVEAMVDFFPPSPPPSAGEAMVDSGPPPAVEEEKEDEVYFSDDEDMSPADYALYCSQVNESCGFDVGFFKHSLNGIFPGGWSCLDIILAKTGLHCYNIEKGRKLQYKRVVKVNGEIADIYNSYSTLEVIDSVDNSLHTFQTLVTDGGQENKARMICKSRICRIKPQVPGKGDANTEWDYDAIDAFYKGNLPDWPLNAALTGGGFYEVKESELRDHEFYAEVALYSEWSCNLKAYLPFKMNRVVVQTKEDHVDSSMKLNSTNAIYYLSFKVPRGPECRGIVRKTSDGITGHMCLEARCWIDN